MMSSLTQLGDTNLDRIKHEKALEPLKKLEYAVCISKGVADMHSIDKRICVSSLFAEIWTSRMLSEIS